MTAAVPAASADAAAAAGRRPTGWRRHRSSLLIVVSLVMAVVLVLLIGGQESARTADYDPGNSGPAGAQALARVLDDQGVDVSVVRSADAFDGAEVGVGTTVMVTSTDQLGTSTIERLLDHGAGSRIVLVDPGFGVLDKLGVDFPSALDTDDPLASDCADALYADLEIDVDEGLAYEGDGCFASALVERGDLVLFGAGQALTNDQVLRADNAAVGLRLLGQDERLVWYVPTYDDLKGDDGVDVWSLLPDWIKPGLWLLLVGGILLVVWRARRLGPLATEPLPVVVKAIETTRSRGRLYRKAGDRAHAAAALRAAERSRAADRLRLGTGHDEQALVRDVARQVQRPEAEVHALIGASAPAPETDRDLIHLASALAALDREVRRR